MYFNLRRPVKTNMKFIATIAYSKGKVHHMNDLLMYLKDQKEKPTDSTKIIKMRIKIEKYVRSVS